MKSVRFAIVEEGPFRFNVREFRPDFVCANGYNDGHLFRSDPESGATSVIEDFGSGWPEEWDGRSWTPPYVQAPVPCRDRWLYYARGAKR